MAWSETITANWNDERFKDPVYIGSGPYAWVFRCNDNQTGGIVAVKYYQLTLEGGLPHRILRDFAALHALNHPNVVRPIFARMELNCIKLVMEYVNSDLGKYLKDVPQLDPNDIKSFMFQILQGLSHCHSHGIVHRDLQPDNLLLDRDTKRIKIADFAHIRKSDDPPTANEITTQQYNPPEILLRTMDLTTAADIWSLGCTFAEMVKGRRLFPGPFDYVVLTNIIKTLGVPNEQAWPGITNACHQLLGEVDPTALLPSRELDLAELFRELEPSALNLLTRMLRFLPNERISVADALQHPYFHDLQNNQ